MSEIITLLSIIASVGIFIYCTILAVITFWTFFESFLERGE